MPPVSRSDLRTIKILAAARECYPALSRIENATVWNPLMHCMLPMISVSLVCKTGTHWSGSKYQSGKGTITGTKQEGVPSDSVTPAANYA